jgi:type IV pilus secretin PilQ/predicted competence protein
MMAHKATVTTAFRRTTLGIASATVVSAAVAGSILLTAASSSVRLLSVTTQGAAVVIEATEPVAYSVSRPDPLTLLVDLRNVAVAEATTRVDPKGPITAVRLEQATAPDGLGVARVRISLARAAEYKVRSSRNAIRVELSGPSTPLGAGPSTPLAAAGPSAPVAPATPPVVPASREAALSPVRTAAKPDAPVRTAGPAGVAEEAVVPGAMATSIERVRTTRNGRSTIVTISGNGRLTPTGVTESRDLPRRVILDFPNVSPAAPGPTPGDGELVRRVRVALNNNTPLVTRVVMEISDTATYTVRRNSPTERELTLVFDRPSPAGTSGSAAAKEDAALAAFGGETITLAQALVNGAPLAPPSDATTSSGAMSALKTSGTLAARAPATPAPAVGVPAQPPAPAPASPQSPAPAPTTPAPATSPILQPNENQIATGQEKKYTGHPISMDFQGVDLRSVLRTFAEISGLNMVIDPDVQGTVDIVLTDVPWDQALSVILGGNQLDYTVDGTIVRIAKIETLRREQDARTQLAQSAANAGALAVRTYALSYAKADQAAPLVRQSVLSPRGNVQIDARTNTLIITDLPARLDTVSSLLSTIDRAEPQVEIEARIITTTRDYARALGVQWGFNGRANSTIGNTTNLTFPNNGSLGGRVGSQGAAASGDTRANPLDDVGTAVNLAAEAASSAVGLALGSINGAFNLDVALSALERQGKGRILSTPRVTTQNNVEAEITQGVQIPVQTEANNTITVTFKDAALTLKVTPQITAANTVIMQITLENATPGTPVQGIPSINTQRAITRVQVSDGMTTVMGGIFVSRESTVQDRTPVLHRIPFLGWLFKRDDKTDSSDELLIFITPRIQKG